MAGLITFFRTSREYLGHARTAALLVAVLFLFLGLDGARAAAYMKLGDIKGESSDNSVAPGEVVLLNFETEDVSEVLDISFEPAIFEVRSIEMDRGGLHVQCLTLPDIQDAVYTITVKASCRPADGTSDEEEVESSFDVTVQSVRRLSQYLSGVPKITDDSAPLMIEISGSNLNPEFAHEAQIMARCMSGGVDQDCDSEPEDCDDAVMRFSVSPPNGSWVGASSLHIEVSHPSGAEFSGDLKLDTSGLADLGGVSVQTGDASADAAIDLGASAFTHSVSCPFTAGNDAPKVELVSHELAHVVQQKGGVQLRSSGNGEWVAQVSCPITGNDGSLEPSADGTIQLSIDGETYEFDYEVALIWPQASISSFEITDIEGSLHVLPSGKLSPDQGEITLRGFFNGKFLRAEDLSDEQVSVRDGQTELQVVSSEISVEDGETASCKVVVRGWDPTTKRKIAGADDLGDEIELTVACIVAGQKFSSSIGCPVEVVKPKMRALKLVINPLKQGLSCVSGPEGTEWDESSVDCPILIGRDFAQEGTEVSVTCVVSPEMKGSSLAGQEVECDAGDVELDKKQLMSSLSLDFSSLALPNDGSLAQLRSIPVLLHVVIGDAEADVALDVPLTIETEETEAILIGLLLPAVQKVSAADTTSLEFDIQFSGENLTDEFMQSITVEDLVIDEREMTTGADWDYRLAPGANGYNGHVTVLKIAAGGGGGAGGILSWWLETCGGEQKSSCPVTCVVTDPNGNSQTLEASLEISWPDSTPMASSLEASPQGPVTSLDNGEVLVDFVIEGENLPEDGSGKFAIEIEGCGVASASVVSVSGGGSELTGTLRISSITPTKELDKSSPLLARLSYLDSSGQPLVETAFELELSDELSSPPAILVGLLLNGGQPAEIQADGSLSVDFELRCENMTEEDLSSIEWSVESSSSSWDPGEYSPSYRTYQPGQPVYGNITFEGRLAEGGGDNGDLRLKFVGKRIAPPGGGGDSEVEAELVCRIMSIPPAITALEVISPNQIAPDGSLTIEFMITQENLIEADLSSIEWDVDCDRTIWDPGEYSPSYRAYQPGQPVYGNITFEGKLSAEGKKGLNAVNVKLACRLAAGGGSTEASVEFEADMELLPPAITAVELRCPDELQFGDDFTAECPATLVLNVENFTEEMLSSLSVDVNSDVDGASSLWTMGNPQFPSPDQMYTGELVLDGNLSFECPEELFAKKDEPHLIAALVAVVIITGLNNVEPPSGEGTGGPIVWMAPESMNKAELVDAIAGEVSVADLDGDGLLDVAVTCAVTGHMLGALAVEDLDLRCVIGGEVCDPSSSTEMEPGDAEITLKRTFAFPHVLEASGRSTGTQNTFDTTLFVTYSPTGQEVSASTTVAVDPKDLDKSQPTLRSLEITVGDIDGDGSDDLDCVVGGEDCDDIDRDSLNVVCLLDGKPVECQWIIVNAHTGAFDMSVFGFNPEEIAAAARTAGKPEVEMELVVSLADPTGGNGGGGGGSVSKTFIMPHILEQKGRITAMSVAGSPVLEDLSGEVVLDLDIEGEDLIDYVSGQKAKAWMVNNFTISCPDGSCTARVSKIDSFTIKQGTTGYGGGGGSGKVNVQDLHFTKRIDKSTPLLMMLSFDDGESSVQAEFELKLSDAVFKELDKSQPTLRSLEITVGDLDGDGSPELACVIGGEDCDDLDRDSLSVVCLLDGQPVESKWELGDTSSSAFDLSVFGFNPQEIAAAARTAGKPEVEMELVVSLADPTGGNGGGGGGGGSVSKTFIMPHILESKGKLSRVSSLAGTCGDLDGDGALDLVLTCVVSGENLANVSADELSVHAVVDGEDVVLDDFELDSSDNELTLRRTFVMPHVLETSGRIAGSQFTFDTTIFVTYNPSGQEVTSSCAVPVDPKDLDKSMPHFSSFRGGISVATGDINGDGVADISLSCVIDGENLAELTVDDLNFELTLEGAPCPIDDLQITDSSDKSVSLAVFVFEPQEIAAAARAARTGRNPQTGKEIKISAKSVASLVGDAAGEPVSSDFTIDALDPDDDGDGIPTIDEDYLFISSFDLLSIERQDDGSVACVVGLQWTEGSEQFMDSLEGLDCRVAFAPAGQCGSPIGRAALQGQPDSIVCVTDGPWDPSSLRSSGWDGGDLDIEVQLDENIVSPRDAASGLPTGKRQHKPIRIMKRIDQTTPLLMNVSPGGGTIIVEGGELRLSCPVGFSGQNCDLSTLSCSVSIGDGEDEDCDGTVDELSYGGGTVQIGLLLPAVQKVREAASRNGGALYLRCAVSLSLTGIDGKGGDVMTEEIVCAFSDEAAALIDALDNDDDNDGIPTADDVDYFFYQNVDIESVTPDADGLDLAIRCSDGACVMGDGSVVPVADLSSQALVDRFGNAELDWGFDLEVNGQTYNTEGSQNPLMDALVHTTIPRSKGDEAGTLKGVITQYCIVSPRDAASGLPTGKRDAASGLPTGKRQHKPISISKEMDASTPKLYGAVLAGLSQIDRGSNENWNFQGSLRLTGENLDLSGSGQGTGLHIFIEDEDGDTNEMQTTVDEISSGEATVTIGLLLPAVQKVREAAARSKSKEDVYVWKLRCVMDSPDGSSSEVLVDDAFTMLLSDWRDNDSDGDSVPEDVDAFFFDDIIIGAISQRDRTLVVAFACTAGTDRLADGSVAPAGSTYPFVDWSVDIVPDGSSAPPVSYSVQLPPGTSSHEFAVEFPLDAADASLSRMLSEGQFSCVVTQSCLVAPRDAASGLPTGRREPGSGMATGKRQHKPLSLSIAIEGGIDGESTPDKHKDWIEVLSFSGMDLTDFSNTDGSLSGNCVCTDPFVGMADGSVRKLSDLSSDESSSLFGDGSVRVFVEMELPGGQLMQGEGDFGPNMDSLIVPIAMDKGLRFDDSSSGGEIEILSWSWGVVSPRDASSGMATGKREAGSGMATGRRTYEPIVIRKRIDKSSPLLASVIVSNPLISLHEQGLRLDFDATFVGENLRDVLIPASMEMANGVDDDCDSEVDEDFGIDGGSVHYSLLLPAVQSAREALGRRSGDGSFVLMDTFPVSFIPVSPDGSGGEGITEMITFNVDRIEETKGIVIPPSDDLSIDDSISPRKRKINIESMVWVWNDGGVTAEDDWETPVAIAGGGGGTEFTDDWQAPSLRVSFIIEGDDVSPEQLEGAVLVFTSDSPGFASASAPITFTQLDAQRSRGDTTLGDVVVVRELDKSSTKLMLSGDLTFEGGTQGRVAVETIVAKMGRVELAISPPGGGGGGAATSGDADDRPTEEVAFYYNKITWAWTDGSTTAVDDWESPAARSSGGGVTAMDDWETPVALMLEIDMEGEGITPEMFENAVVSFSSDSPGFQDSSAPLTNLRMEGGRVRGDTTLGDVVVVRELDKSSTKLQMGGTLTITGSTIDGNSTAGSENEPYREIAIKPIRMDLSIAAPGGSGGDDGGISTSYVQASAADNNGRNIYVSLFARVAGPDFGGDVPTFEARLADGTAVPVTVDDMQVSNGTTEVLIGLLLPAVQQVREAAASDGSLSAEIRWMAPESLRERMGGNTPTRWDMLVLDLSGDGTRKQGDPDANRYDFGSDGIVNGGGAVSLESIKVQYTVQADDHSAGDEHEVEFDIAAGAFHDQDAGMSFDDFRAQFEDGRFVLRSGVPVIRSSSGSPDIESSDYELTVDEGGGAVYMKIKMKPIYITSFQTGGSSGDAFDFEGSLLFEGKSSFEIGIKPIRLDLQAVSGGGGSSGSTYGGSRATYLKYEMKNVMVSSFSVSSSGQAECVVDLSEPMCILADGSSVPASAVPEAWDSVHELEVVLTLPDGTELTGMAQCPVQTEMLSLSLSGDLPPGASSGREDTMEIYGFSHEVVSPRDAASGLPTGKREPSFGTTSTVTVDRADLSVGDGSIDALDPDSDDDGVLDLVVLSSSIQDWRDTDDDNDGVCDVVVDFELSSSTDFTVDSFFDVTYRLDFPDGSSFPGSVEYQDGDDLILRKRPGRTKYSNITLKRGMLAGRDETHTEFPATAVCVLPDGTEIRKDVVIRLTPADSDSINQSRKFKAGADLSKKVNISPGGGDGNLDLIVSSVSYGNYLDPDDDNDGVLDLTVDFELVSRADIDRNGFPDILRLELSDGSVFQGSVEYQDGDDIILRKRPGRTKYSNITLKRGVMAGRDETHTQFPASVVCTFPDGSEIRKDITVELSPEDSARYYNKRKFSEAALEERASETGVADNLGSTGNDPAARKNKQEPYLTYKLKDVIVTSYSVSPKVGYWRYNEADQTADIELEFNIEGSEDFPAMVLDGAVATLSSEAFDDVSGVIEYQDGDDIILRKRPGRVKYSNITLKPGYAGKKSYDYYKAQSDLACSVSVTLSPPDSGDSSPAFRAMIARAIKAEVARLVSTTAGDGGAAGTGDNTVEEKERGITINTSHVEYSTARVATEAPLVDGAPPVVISGLVVDVDESFMIDSFFDITYRLEFPDGSSFPGVVEYQDGDDPITRKRPGRVKYGDITLKRGVMDSGADGTGKTISAVLIGKSADGSEVQCPVVFPIDDVTAASWKEFTPAEEQLKGAPRHIVAPDGGGTPGAGSGPQLRVFDGSSSSSDRSPGRPLPVPYAEPTSEQGVVLSIEIDNMPPGTDVDSAWETCSGGSLQIEVSDSSTGSDQTHSTTPGHKYVDTLTLRAAAGKDRKGMMVWYKDMVEKGIVTGELHVLLSDGTELVCPLSLEFRDDDSDGDGILDYLDSDSDDDGLTESVETDDSSGDGANGRAQDHNSSRSNKSGLAAPDFGSGGGDEGDGDDDNDTATDHNSSRSNKTSHTPAAGSGGGDEGDGGGGDGADADGYVLQRNESDLAFLRELGSSGQPFIHVAPSQTVVILMGLRENSDGDVVVSLESDIWIDLGYPVQDGADASSQPEPPSLMLSSSPDVVFTATDGTITFTGLEFVSYASTGMTELTNDGSMLLRKRPGRVKYADVMLKRGYIASDLPDWWLSLMSGEEGEVSVTVLSGNIETEDGSAAGKGDMVMKGKKILQNMLPASTIEALNAAIAGGGDSLDDGAIRDFDWQQVDGPFKGGVHVAVGDVNGVTVYMVPQPEDDELAAAIIARLRKRPDLLMQEWDELIDESFDTVQTSPLYEEAGKSGSNPLFEGRTSGNTNPAFTENSNAGEMPANDRHESGVIHRDIAMRNILDMGADFYLVDVSGVGIDTLLELPKGNAVLIENREWIRIFVDKNMDGTLTPGELRPAADTAGSGSPDFLVLSLDAVFSSDNKGSSLLLSCPWPEDNGDGSSWYFLPEVDDEVIVSFMDGDPDRPIILGRLFNGTDRPEGGISPLDAPVSARMRVILDRGEAGDNVSSMYLIPTVDTDTLEVCLVVSEDELAEGRKYQTISNALKASHDAAMSSIRNMK